MSQHADRILTTHVDSLVRPPDVLEDILLMAAGKSVDKKIYVPFQLVTPDNMDKFTKKN